MIKLENIKKVFRTEEVETWALREVNLEVKEGEFVAIMGPSGCGKSTLLNIIGLLDNPTNGTYTLNVFDKPDEQSQDSLSYAMAKKRLSKTNVFAKPDGQSQARPPVGRVSAMRLGGMNGHEYARKEQGLMSLKYCCLSLGIAYFE